MCLKASIVKRWNAAQNRASLDLKLLASLARDHPVAPWSCAVPRSLDGDARFCGVPASGKSGWWTPQRSIRPAPWWWWRPRPPATRCAPAEPQGCYSSASRLREPTRTDQSQPARIWSSREAPLLPGTTEFPRRLKSPRRARYSGASFRGEIQRRSWDCGCCWQLPRWAGCRYWWGERKGGRPPVLWYTRWKQWEGLVGSCTASPAAPPPWPPGQENIIGSVLLILCILFPLGPFWPYLANHINAMEDTIY